MHLTPTLIVAVARGALPRRVLLEIGREHLAAICPICAEAMASAELALRLEEGVTPAAYDEALEAVRRRLGLRVSQLRAEEKTARKWVREILRLGPERRLDRIAGAYKNFRGPVFGTLLLEEARKAIPGDPAESLSLAEAVLVSCDRTQPYHPDPEIRVPALAARGNALRALGRLQEAEEGLKEARRLLETSDVADVTVAAELDSYEGSLRKDQGRYGEAARCVHRAIALYRLVGELERVARLEVQLGMVHYYRHDFAAAISATETALELLDREAEPSLVAYAGYNLAHFLYALGDLDRAEATLAAHEELLGEAGEWGILHQVWLRAKIAWSRRDLDGAERLFTEARGRARARGVAFDTSLVSLELALVHLARGRTDDVRRLATDAFRVFAEQEVERETLAALELVDQAARREALTREMVEGAVATLERTRHRPSSKQVQ